MYATEVTVRIEQGREEEARQGLMERVLPEVKGTPGIIGGYWMAPEGAVGHSVILWDTREHAEAVVAQLQKGSHPTPPVTVEQVEVHEVIATV
ncbi:MAG TPA: hypothetical protein VFV41_21290 [Streptosporangiaceae bacterium]|nr:hypothetical protein [Streptosporangiaceae bacterium]